MEDKRQLNSYLIFVVAVLVMLLIVLASYYNYMEIQNNTIEIGQNQLLSLSETVADSIERFFRYQSDNMEILGKNKYFLNDYISYRKGLLMDATFQNLEDYYSIQSDSIELIRLIDVSGNEIFTYPTTDYGNGIYKDIEKLLLAKEKVVGNIYREKEALYINILQPIFINNEINAILYSKIKLENIYRSLIEPVKAGEKGYASVKDSDGVLIMHPNVDDIGENVIDARMSAYPDFDWSELEELVERQKRGESGVGVYHSLWFNDNNQKRVKKFSAYSPAHIGDDFWIVTVSKDYLEVVSFLRERTYNIIIINFFIVMMFVTGLLYLYRVKKDRALIAKEHSLLLKVKELNEELEEDIRQRIVLERELIQSKNRFENIFESGSDCIFVVDFNDDVKIVEVNLKVTNSLKYLKDELLGMYYKDISSRMTSSLHDEIQYALSNSSSYMFEDELICKDKKLIPVEINIKKMEDEKSNLMVMISRDITMKKLFEEEAIENKKKEALMLYQSRLAAMGEMIGSIAHQWRQPLSGISMIFNNIEDAFEYNDLDEAFLKEQGKRLQDLVKYMSQTIDDFRFFFNPKVDKEKFLMSKIVSQTMDFLRESIRLNNIETIIDIPSDILMYGRPNQLSQVIFSIIKNSIDAIENNKCDIRSIKLFCYEMDGDAVIKIEDSGGGISDEKLGKIFDMYYTTKEAQNGTGLGLYIAKVIVEKNFNGEISAFNGELGLDIVIKLPIE